MKKDISNLNANETIYEAIRQIALHKLVNPHTNVIKNTSKISGFVVKVHTDASDELCGTDVYKRQVYLEMPQIITI